MFLVYEYNVRDEFVSSRTLSDNLQLRIYYTGNNNFLRKSVV